MEIAAQLAKWIVKTGPEEISKVVLEKAKVHLLDTIGVMIGGATDDVGRVITEYVQALGGNQPVR